MSNRINIKRFKSSVFMALAALMLTSCHQMDVEVRKIPGNTPENEPIFITGNFNNWDPGDERYRLRLDENDSVWKIDLPYGVGRIEYKFTRGDWTRVEKDQCGYEIENRHALYGSTEIISDTILSWNDQPAMDCPMVTIVINELPANTPKDARISLAGSINSWDPENDDFVFTNDEETGRLVLTVPKIGDNRIMEYKLTRGNLERIESDVLGREIAVRELTFGDQDTIFIEVKGWEDLAGKGGGMLTIIVTDIPANTPVGDRIYLVSDLNNWIPGQASMMLEQNRRGQYFINIPKSKKEMFFKFTRGGWKTVETDRYGYDIDNRHTQLEKVDTIKVKIANWMDLFEPLNTPIHLIVDGLPDYTPTDDNIYVAGNFNDWSPGNRKWVLKLNSDGKYSIDIPRTQGLLEFKLTRGSWSTVESDGWGEDIENRVFRYSDVEVIHVKVKGWKDLE